MENAEPDENVSASEATSDERVAQIVDTLDELGPLVAELKQEVKIGTHDFTLI